MNPRVTFLSATLIALIGLVVVMLIGKGKDGVSANGETSISDRHKELRPFETARHRDAIRSDRERRSRRGPTLAALTEEYGEERVEYAQRIAASYVTYNKASEHSVDSIFNSPGIDVLMTHKLMTDAFGVILEPDQEKQATEVAYRYALRELADFKRSRLELERKPERLLALILASDARSRDEILEGEYAALQHRYAGAFGNLMNPLDHRNSKRLWERDPTGEVTLRMDVEAILTAEQRAIYQAGIEAYDAAPNTQQPVGFAAMEPMDLMIHEVQMLNQPWSRAGGFHTPGSTFKKPSNR